MKKQEQNKTAKKADVTLNDFFKVVDKVAKKAKTDSSFRKLIDSADHKWQNEIKYAI